MNKNQNDSRCSCEHCETQKKLYKKVFGFISSRFLFFAIGFFISVAVLTAYAAWNDTVSSGDLLTATKWNDVIDHLKKRESDWKILAQGADWTEEAVITLKNTGATFTTDQAWADQRVNVGTVRWPENGSAQEIIFTAYNPEDQFCMGGGFVQDLVGGGGTNPTCQDFRYSGTTLTRVNISELDGIKITINGVDMDYCPDQYGRVSNNPSFKGTYAEDTNSGTAFCHYKAGVDYTLPISTIEVKEYDHSPLYGIWNWEVWYK